MNRSRYFVAFCLMTTLLCACGGGGVSDAFTREINDVELAWKNATNSFTASSDSVIQARKAWEEMMTGMAIPDSVRSRVTPEYKVRLDSVLQICANEGKSYDDLLAELQTARTGWDNDSKVFADWKDKVFKSEIDIETARKDLKDYQEKVKQNTSISNQVGPRINEIRQRCAANCQVYDGMVTAIPKEAPEPRRRGR